MAKFLFASFISLLLTGCAVLKSETPKTYNIEIVSVSKTTTAYNSPQLIVTIKNTGTGVIYNVGGKIKAKNGNTIIDTAAVYFAGLGNIQPGESATDDGVFFTLKAHSDYAELDYSGITFLTE